MTAHLLVRVLRVRSYEYIEKKNCARVKRADKKGRVNFTVTKNTRTCTCTLVLVLTPTRAGTRYLYEYLRLFTGYECVTRHSGKDAGL